MPVALISASAYEAEAHLSNAEIRNDIDTVGTMVVDLTEETDIVNLLFVVPEQDENERWQLCFGGSTLSLDFYPNSIEVTDFNDGDEVVVETFPRENIKQATQWLVNHLRN